MITVLLTGVGAPGTWGTIDCLRNNPDKEEIKIIGVDAKDNVVGKYLCDEFATVPKGEDPAFISAIKKIVKDYQVDVILPQVESELLPLAATEDLEAVACVSSFRSIANASDKGLATQTADRIGIPTPRGVLLDGNVVLRQIYGSGGDGMQIIPRDHPTIVTEFLPGKEYTVDCFRGEGRFQAIPRQRISIRDGITFDAKVDLRKDLMVYSKKLAKELDLKYCFGFQFKEDSDGVPRFLECNPRVQGTMVVARHAGFNMIYYSVKEAMGQPFDGDVTLKEISYKRYWGGLVAS